MAILKFASSQAAFGRRCGQLMLRVLLQHIATHLQRNTSDIFRLLEISWEFGAGPTGLTCPPEVTSFRHIPLIRLAGILPWLFPVVAVVMGLSHLAARQPNSQDAACYSITDLDSSYHRPSGCSPTSFDGNSRLQCCCF